MREKVVDVAEVGLGGLGQDETAFGFYSAVGGVDGRIAVETMPLLIAIERSTG